VVTFVSLCVHVYTIGYMHDDPGYQRFFSYISLFTFAMLMLVMSNNFMQLFFGWEAVGVVSYLLIGFWYTRPTAIFANMKAFLVNRVGDFGFVLGIAASSTSRARSTTRTPLRPRRRARDGLALFGHLDGLERPDVICICLFIGAMGKSAQVPLHVWLPDSMEGPTPISALIHAATMVTAGIFMVARMSPLFEGVGDGAVVRAGDRRDHGAVHGLPRHHPERHQARRRLLDAVAARLHDGRARRVGLLGRDLPPDDACVLQGAAVPRRRLGDHRHAPRAGHAQDGRPAQVHADHGWITSLIGSLALIGTPFFSGFFSKDLIIEAVHERSLGRHLRRSARAGRRVRHRALQLPDDLHDLPRHGAGRNGPFPASTTIIRAHGAHDAHGADGHGHAVAATSAGDAAHDKAGHDDHGTPTAGTAMAASTCRTRARVVTLPLVLLAIPSLLIGA
jgi:NADH-quinone oxidoreductase subunit L